MIIQNLENNELLLNAILLPASTHMYFEEYSKDNLVSFIYYTNPIFLLQGPPGTGKSQTITNIIAEFIANKKLFYSLVRNELPLTSSINV